ncbi:hypothetical protein PybrP1_002659 [[Pythium] brassicae (nom. inval.)]|nr:hypothetical protein PybrP1_002659 [[Pythium] brassicae (nom. inval.)]
MAEAVVVRVLASLTALVMCLSPSAEIRRIHERRAVERMPALPLVAQWLYNHTWMLYGFAVQEYFPLLATYAVGSALSVAFLGVFYLHAHEQRPYVRTLVAAALVLNVAATAYAVGGASLFGTGAVAEYVGALAILYGALLYASPLATVVAVVRTKSAESIPLAMVGVGATSNAVWIVYGCMLDDPLVTAPAAVNAAFCALQLGLCAVYHPKRASLKATVARIHCRLARRASRASPAESGLRAAAAERDVSSVHLETPKYEELRSPTALYA